MAPQGFGPSEQCIPKAIADAQRRLQAFARLDLSSLIVATSGDESEDGSSKMRVSSRVAYFDSDDVCYRVVPRLVTFRTKVLRLPPYRLARNLCNRRLVLELLPTDSECVIYSYPLGS